MSVKRLFLALAVLCGAASVRITPAQAQGDIAWPEWMQAGGKMSVSEFDATFFFDPLHGVTAALDFSHRTLILHTVGNQWWSATIPGGTPPIKSIRLIQGKLYAATGGPDVLRSTDSGATWQLSGLGLSGANDVYPDGSGIIRALTNPMQTFARLDTLHCMATGGGSVYISTDGGLTWNSIVTGLNVNSSGAFADRCHNVFLAPSSWGTALRSTDLGQTWRTVITGSGPFPEAITGASTVSYISTLGGMYRATDDGLTWQSVITVNGGPHIMYAWGPMGEHVAIGWMGNSFLQRGIWMTTTGGLDDLHSGVNMTDSNGAPLMQDDTFNVPFHLISTCQAMTIPIPFQADVEGLSEKVSILNDSLGDFSLVGQTTIVTLRRSFSGDTLWLSYNPHHAVSNVVLKFDNHWQCSDWSETRTVHVVAIPTADLEPPPLFVASCMPDTETAMLVLDSCQTIVIDSVLIPASIAPYLTFAAPFPDTARLGHGDALPFRFDPGLTLGYMSDSVEVFAHCPGMDSALSFYDWRWFLGNDTTYGSLTDFHKKIPVRMLATASVALVTRDSILNIKRPALCANPEDTVATFINKGCTPDTITRVAIAGSHYNLLSFSLPIIIAPGKWAQIPIEFGAPDTGVFTGSLTLSITSGETKQIVLPLSATGYPHYGIMEMSASSLDAGMRNVCVGEVTLRDTIRNVGCDTLFLSPAQLSGNVEGLSDTSLSLLAPLAQYVLPGDSTVLAVRLGTRIKGVHTDTIHYQFAQTSKLLMRDTTVLITANIIHGESFLVTSIDGAAFGPMYVCESYDTTLWISNPGCDTLFVDSIAFDNPSFTSTAPFPVKVLPDSSVPLTFHIAPDTSAAPAEIKGKLFIYSKASILPIDTLPLDILTIIYPEHLALTLLQADSGRAGEQVTYTLVLTGGDQARRDILDSITFDLTHDDDLLGYIDTTLGSALSVVSGPSVNGQVTQHYTLKPVPASDTVGTLTFKAYLAKSSNTALTLSNIMLGNGRALPNDCIASLDSAGSTFAFIGACGDGPMRQLMASGVFTIDNIRPNPARDQIEVRVSGAGDRDLDLEMCDALGRVVHSEVLHPSSLGLHPSSTLDVSRLPSGVYDLRLCGGGLSSSRRVVIQR